MITLRIAYMEPPESALYRIGVLASAARFGDFGDGLEADPIFEEFIPFGKLFSADQLMGVAEALGETLPGVDCGSSEDGTEVWSYSVLAEPACNAPGYVGSVR